MGCCGDDEDDLLPSNPNPNSSATGGLEESSVAVLSPMNSYLPALSSADLLRSILELLEPADLARAACVSRLWREVATEREVVEGAFRAPWRVRRVLGNPSTAAFWRHPSLQRFAISHRLRAGDSVPGLALKYSVQVMDIKRLNNMMSEHGIYSRERLLIPISSSKAELLHGSTCYIELDAHAKREVAVLYLEGGPLPDDGKASCAATERGRRKVLDSVKRSMHVDDGTAEYYLSVSNGDPRAAILQFSEDLRWEQQRTASR